MARYRARISGPLMDRIDLMVEVPAVAESDLAGASTAEASAPIRARVEAARDLQLARQGKPNAALGPKEVDAHCKPDERGARLLSEAMKRLGLSARAYHRILKVARSIADLAGGEGVAASHVAEATQYRRLDRG